MDLVRMYLRPGTKDAATLDEIQAYNALDIRPGDVCLDLGANIGAWTCRALAKGAKVIAVEPDPDNYDVLCQNADGKAEALYNCAVAAQEGWVTLHRSNTTTCHSLNDVSFGQMTHRDVIKVHCVSLPALVRAHKPTIIKCDVEGAEHILNWDCLESVRELAMEVHYFNGEKDILSAVSIISVIERQGLLPLHQPHEMSPHRAGFQTRGFGLDVRVGIWKREQACLAA